MQYKEANRKPLRPETRIAPSYRFALQRSRLERIATDFSNVMYHRSDEEIVSNPICRYEVAGAALRFVCEVDVAGILIRRDDRIALGYEQQADADQ